MRSGLEPAGEAGFLPRFVLLRGKLAACLGKAGEVERGLDTVEQAIARSDETEERWVMDELLRVKGAGRVPTRGSPAYDGSPKALIGRSLHGARAMLEPPMTVS